MEHLPVFSVGWIEHGEIHHLGGTADFATLNPPYVFNARMWSMQAGGFLPDSETPVAETRRAG